MSFFFIETIMQEELANANFIFQIREASAQSSVVAKLDALSKRYSVQKLVKVKELQSENVIVANKLAVYFVRSTFYLAQINQYENQQHFFCFFVTALRFFELSEFLNPALSIISTIVK